MNEKLIQKLHEWRNHGNPTEKAHAEWRLAEFEKAKALVVVSPQPKPAQLQYPSFIQQAKNAFAAAGSVAASIVRREAVSVSEEEQNRRLDICKSCEKYDTIQGRCTLCGCFGQWKTWLASQKCPIGKW